MTKTLLFILLILFHVSSMLYASPPAWDRGILFLAQTIQDKWVNSKHHIDLIYENYTPSDKDYEKILEGTGIKDTAVNVYVLSIGSERNVRLYPATFAYRLAAYDYYPSVKITNRFGRQSYTGDLQAINQFAIVENTQDPIIEKNIGEVIFKAKNINFSETTTLNLKDKAIKLSVTKKGHIKLTTLENGTKKYSNTVDIEMVRKKSCIKEQRYITDEGKICAGGLNRVAFAGDLQKDGIEEIILFVTVKWHHSPKSSFDNLGGVKAFAFLLNWDDTLKKWTLRYSSTEGGGNDGL